MLWVALATAIMILTGELGREGQSARALATLLEALRQSIVVSVPAARRDPALRAVADLERVFDAHLRDLEAFSACIDAADRRYRETQAAYRTCADHLENRRVALRAALVAAQGDYEAALAPAERAAVARAVMGMPEAWVLDPARSPPKKSTVPPLSRPRGVEGVASQRHLTLPRNVISIVYGPLSPAMFAQRFPSRIVDGGTSYEHTDWAGAPASTAATPDVWVTRAGVRFGMFDDFEACALFIPFDLAPKLRIDQVPIAFTQQFRLRGVDLALRASFRTPGETGWGIAPGVMAGLHGRRFALQAGVFASMEVGTIRDPETPAFGWNSGLRGTWNVLPELFFTAESGAAYDRLDVPNNLSVPLAFGAGYAWLQGPRLVEFTALFSWDHFLLPLEPDGLSAVQAETFRLTFGVTVSFQAL